MRETRCKRFHVVEPLASPLCEHRERLSGKRETRCKRFHVVEPLAAPLCEHRERLSMRRETRCKRFHVVEPLAAPLCEHRERLSVRRERLSVRRETRCEQRERLSMRRETRCKRFHVVEPLASPLCEQRETPGKRFDVVEPFASRLRPIAEPLSEHHASRCPRRVRSRTRSSTPKYTWPSPGPFVGGRWSWRSTRFYWDGGTKGRRTGLVPSWRLPVPLRQAKPGRGGSHVASRNLSK